MSGRRALGPVGRLGRYAATHFRQVLAGWLLVGLVLGFFAPRVETALSGAGWEATGSQSVQARLVIGRDFQGLSSSALQSLPWAHSDEHRSRRFAAWGERLWRRPVVLGLLAVVVLVGLALPVLSLRTNMPSITVVPKGDSSRTGYDQIQRAFGTALRARCRSSHPARAGSRGPGAGAARSGIAHVQPAIAGAGGMDLVQAIPSSDPSGQAVGVTIERRRAELPPGTLLGGSVAEHHDLQNTLSAKTPLVIGVVLALGFVLLLVALQAPLVAAAGVLTNLLAAGAALGVAKWIFQDGALHSLLGFQPQGFLDAWGPVFFFAMIFAISMDYTVFLLSSTKEHWDRTGEPHEALVNGIAHSGRVIFAAAAVMVAVFFTFALSGPLPPKEMGVILGVAVLLDAALVRLLLLPVLLRLMGRWAWYLPRWADRLPTSASDTPEPLLRQLTCPPLKTRRSLMLFTRKPKDVTPEDAAVALAEGELTLVDVRKTGERAEAYVAGSRHIPLDELPGRLGELAADTSVAFVCRSGARSSSAARAAAKHGVQARNVRGGMLAWEKAGLETERADRFDRERSGDSA